MSDFLSFLSCLADYFMDELGFVSGIINDDAYDLISDLL